MLHGAVMEQGAVRVEHQPELAERKPRVPKFLAAAIKIAIGLLLLAALFHYGSIDAGALAGLAQRPGAVVACGILILLTLPVAALRWAIVLRILGLRLPWVALVHMHAIAGFAGQFLLGVASADAVRGVYAWRALRGHSPRIAVSLVADRGLSLAALIALTLVFMLIRFERVAAVAPLAALLVSVALTFAATAAAALALLLAPGVLERLAALVAGWPRTAWLVTQAGAIVGAFRRNLPAAAAAFAVALVGNLLNFLAVTVLAVGLEIGTLGALDYMVATPLALLANSLPLTPGGLGVGEVAFDQACTWLAGSGAGYAGIFFAFRAVAMLVMLVGLVSFVMHRSPD